MGHPPQRLEGHGDHLVRAFSAGAGHEPDAAGVMLAVGIESEGSAGLMWLAHRLAGSQEKRPALFERAGRGQAEITRALPRSAPRRDHGIKADSTGVSDRAKSHMNNYTFD